MAGGGREDHAEQRILVVDDEVEGRRALRRELEERQWVVAEASDGNQAISALRNEHFDLVLTDLHMPNADGFAVLAAVRASHARTPCILLTGQGSLHDCVDALRAGAQDFLIKPYHPSELMAVVESALGLSPNSTAANAALLGQSSRLRKLLVEVERLCLSSVSVTLFGEPGAGAEVVARLLHGLSPRAGYPLLMVRATQPASIRMLDGMLSRFNPLHARAWEEEAGSIFVDEIWCLPQDLQLRLATFLTAASLRTHGGPRLIASTSMPLDPMVAAGRFHHLLHRFLGTEVLTLPPLRERREDMPSLVAYFLDHANRRLGRNVSLQRNVLDSFCVHHWPGNVSELATTIEELVTTDGTTTFRID